MSWLEGWQYRKSHEIQGSTVGAVTDYQIKIIVHYGSGEDSGEHVYLDGKCRTDFGDIRFTSDDGVTELSYWIEEKVDGDYAVFWIKVPSIPASPDTATIYIYYGRSDATTTSNGENAFIFFDHFEGTSLDLTKWDVKQGDVSIADSELKLTGTTGTRGLREGKTAFSIGKAIHTKVRWSTTGAHQHHFCSFRKSGDWNYRVEQYGRDSDVRCETRDAGSVTYTDYTPSTPTSYHVYKCLWKSGKGKFYQDESLKATHTTNVPNIDLVPVFYEGSTSGQDVYVDWIFIRKYVDPEPSHGAWGIEETPLIYKISGYTRDVNGNPIPNCVVWLFRTSDKQFIAETMSNEDGYYEFMVEDDVTEYFIRAHKDGTPNIFGTTDRNLKGEAA